MPLCVCLYVSALWASCPAVEVAACFLVTTAIANCVIGRYSYIRHEPDELIGNICSFPLSYVQFSVAVIILMSSFPF